MNLDVENIDDIVVVTLPGNTLEASNAQEFSDGVAPLIEDNKKVVFELSRLNFIDSTGCRAILMCYKNLKNKGGILHLCGATDRISALFRLMNLYELLGVYENSEDAVKAFGEIEEKP